MLWVYILECDNDSLYTGYTNNLEERYRHHCEGTAQGARFTRAFKPRRIAQSWRMQVTTGNALRVELLIKRLPRSRKLDLIDDPSLLETLVRERLDFSVDVVESRSTTAASSEK